MEPKEKRVLVTGANKGIGYGTVKAFIQKAREDSNSPVHVYLGSRDIERGTSAITRIKEENPDARVELLQLDVASNESIEKAATYLSSTGGLDILINNAGLDFNDKAFTKEGFLNCLNVNYYGVKNLTKLFVDRGILKPNSIVINLGSKYNQISEFESINPPVYELLRNYKTDLTLDRLDQVVAKYVAEVDHETKKNEWMPSAYGISKIFLAIFTYIYARSPEVLERGIQMYTLSPGWVITDMTKAYEAEWPENILPVEAAAEFPIYMTKFKPAVDLTVQGEFFFRTEMIFLQ